MIMAFKGHEGWNGFSPPYYTKYLTRTVKLITDLSDLTYPGGQHLTGDLVTVQQGEFDVDRLTGFPTKRPSDLNFSPKFFPFFGQPIPPNQTPAPGVVNWAVTDNQYSATRYSDEPPLNGLAKFITEVTLSNPYTLGQLDADTNALFNAVDPASINYGQGQVVIYENDSIGGLDLGSVYQGFTQELLPSIAQYAPPRGPFVPSGLFVISGESGTTGIMKLPAPFAVPTLGAAAGYVYAPSPFGEPILAPFDKPGAYMKFVSYIKMAGNYCKKSFYIDWNQIQQSQTCQSGTGTCSETPFLISPPPIVTGRSAYTLLVPNCTCPA